MPEIRVSAGATQMNPMNAFIFIMATAAAAPAIVEIVLILKGYK